jgi:exodeoxyribonuclease-1
MSFVFYDTETTGIDTKFDQILQFAAIYTDSDLNELDRFEIRCRLLPHIVPAPIAMRVTGVRADQLTDGDLPSHYEMMSIIREKMLEWSPSTFLGYNTIDFDEHLLRHAYYRTLHPPYLTSLSGNTRTDILRAAQASSIYSPGALVIPLLNGQKSTFKLDALAPANGFAHENAHDALADVEATIFIARLISERCPDVWSSFMRFSTKAAVIDFVSNEQVFCLSDFYFGKPYSWLVTPLENQSDDTSTLYVFDLGVDPDSLVNLSPAKLKSRLSSSPKPIRNIRSNAAPMIFSADDAPNSASGKNLTQDELERRINVLRENPELRARIIAGFEETKQEQPVSEYVEDQLYSGFFPAGDQKLLDEFHNKEWAERLELIESFEDPRLKILGLQLIHAERPEILAQEIRLEHDRNVARRIAHDNPDLPWLTLPKALAEIDELLITATAPERLLLTEHRNYLAMRLNSALVIL